MFLQGWREAPEAGLCLVGHLKGRCFSCVQQQGWESLVPARMLFKIRVHSGEDLCYCSGGDSFPKEGALSRAIKAWQDLL